MKADILSRKETVDTKEDNKNVQLLKEKLWQQKTTAEITMIKRKMIVEENNILKCYSARMWTDFRVRVSEQK